MQFTAKLIQVLPLQTGTGKNGAWKKQDIIVETEGQYPKKICVSVWGDKIDNDQLKPGNMLKIDFDIAQPEDRERPEVDHVLRDRRSIPLVHGLRACALLN